MFSQLLQTTVLTSVTGVHPARQTTLRLRGHSSGLPQAPPLPQTLTCPGTPSPLRPGPL